QSAAEHGVAPCDGCGAERRRRRRVAQDERPSIPVPDPRHVWRGEHRRRRFANRIRAGSCAMTSVLGRSATATLELLPFPHLIVDNALDADVYAQLVALFPSIEMVNRRARPIRNNHLYLLSAVDVLANEHIAAHWRTFFAYHVSRAFWLEALALLKT